MLASGEATAGCPVRAPSNRIPTCGGGSWPVHSAIAAAAQSADWSVWQALHALGVPIAALKSGRGMRRLWSWRSSICMNVRSGMWQLTQRAPSESTGWWWCSGEV